MAILGKSVAVKWRMVRMTGSLRLPRHPFGVPRNDKVDGLYRGSYVVIARRRPQGRRRGNLREVGRGKMVVGSSNRFPEIATGLTALAMTGVVGCAVGPQNDKIGGFHLQFRLRALAEFLLFRRKNAKVLQF